MQSNDFWAYILKKTDIRPTEEGQYCVYVKKKKFFKVIFVFSPPKKALWEKISVIYPGGPQETVNHGFNTPLVKSPSNLTLT